MVFMNANVCIQLGLYLTVLLLLVKPLGSYMARVFDGRPCGLDRALGWCERGIYRAAGVDARKEMGWKTYALAMLAFNARNQGSAMAGSCDMSVMLLNMNAVRLPASVAK